MAGRVFSKRWPAGWVLGSLVLHTLLLSWGARRHHREPQVAPVIAPTRADTQLEVEVEVAPASPENASVVAARAPGLAHLAVAVPHRAPTAATTAEPADDGAGDPREDAVDAAQPAAAAVSSATTPHLSLAQLGVEGANPFLDRDDDPAAARAAKAARLKRRLDHALAQGLTDADVARGRGAGGPVLRSLEAAIYASNVPLNGQASFVFVIDSEGKLVSSVLGDASTNREAWARVARQTAQSFAARKLTVPKGRGVKLTVAVTSHLELPSGADPGLELSAQGIPFKKGGGPRSSKLDLSIFPFPAATLAGDPADIGARPRRMVHAHVVSEEVL